MLFAPTIPPDQSVSVELAAAPVVHQLPAARPLVTRITSVSSGMTYTVAAGDTLSGIAGRACGNPGDWPAIWHQDQAEIANPALIYPGQVLTFTCGEAAAAQAPASAPPAQPGKVWGVSYGDPNYCGDGDGDGWDVACHAAAAAPQPAVRQSAAQAPASSGAVSTAGMSAFEQCVIARESGGNAQVMNASGHYGLYQFDLSTWVSGGGNPADFGHASVAEQQRVFSAVYVARGVQPWQPSDGCS
jgi:Transglycosylase-like domain/LysM domain